MNIETAERIKRMSGEIDGLMEEYENVYGGHESHADRMEGRMDEITILPKAIITQNNILILMKASEANTDRLAFLSGPPKTEQIPQVEKWCL